VGCSFASSAKTRITWLEDVIRQHLPNFDLDSGPKVDLNHVDAAPEHAEQISDRASSEANDAQEPSTIARNLQDPSTETVSFRKPQIKSSLKRSYSFAAESEKERHFSDQVRSVAIDLGMLSLNTDSRQRHYLGSSSGLLFTRLIEADNDPRTRTPQSMQGGMQTSGEWEGLIPEKRSRFIGHARPMKQTHQWLYNKIRSVRNLGYFRRENLSLSFSTGSTSQRRFFIFGADILPSDSSRASNHSPLVTHERARSALPLYRSRK
jgi:hypothetical protein